MSTEYIKDKYKKVYKGDGAFARLREDAYVRFEEIGMPKRGAEKYTYLNVRNIDYKGFKLPGLESNKNSLVDGKKVALESYGFCTDNILVFAQGVYREDLSKISEEGLEITNIGNGQMGEAGLAEDSLRYLNKRLVSEDESFALLNGIFMNDLYIIRVRGKISKPLQILHILENGVRDAGAGGGELQMLCPRLQYIFEEGSSCTIYVKHIGSLKDGLISHVEDFILKEGASVEVNVLHKCGTYEDNRFVKRSFYQGGGSRCILSTGVLASKVVRNEYEVYIDGEGAYFGLNGLSVLEGREESHNYIKVCHRSPGSESEQVFKNIVKDRGKASVDTTVLVEKGAQKTNSMQLVQSLILSDEGESASKPNLMIYADDVKCNHGATVGNLDDASILYLKTRGIAEETARRLLLIGFMQTVIEKMGEGESQEEAFEFFLDKLEGGIDYDKNGYGKIKEK